MLKDCSTCNFLLVTFVNMLKIEYAHHYAPVLCTFFLEGCFVAVVCMQIAEQLVRGPIPKSRSEKAVWSHEREQRFLYINVKIRPSLVRLRRSY